MTRTLIAVFALAVSACGAEAPAGGQSSASSSASAESVTAAAAVDAAVEGGSDSGADVIEVGSQAPGFELPGSDGATHQLSGYAGQHVVLAFFPKAFTGG